MDHELASVTTFPKRFGQPSRIPNGPPTLQEGEMVIELAVYQSHHLEQTIGEDVFGLSTGMIEGTAKSISVGRLQATAEGGNQFLPMVRGPIIRERSWAWTDEGWVVVKVSTFRNKC